MRRIKFKPSLRDTRLAVAHQFAFMASAAPEHRREAAEKFAAEAMASVPAAPKRRVPKDGVDIDAAHGAKRTPRDLEGPVVSAISELLATHPKVLFAVRQNTGMASYEAASGKYAPVYFYRKLTHGKELTITDFWGILKDGRMLAIEAKAPGFKEPHTDREFAQANFLMLIRNVGGISLFATDAAQVAAALK